MSERKFARVLCKPGSAAQVRESVSKAVRVKTIYQNKSLLVDTSPEIEYSKRKFFTLKKKENSDGVSNQNLEEIEDYNCNLFVRECLRTYSTPFLEFIDLSAQETFLKSDNKLLTVPFTSTTNQPISITDNNNDGSDKTIPPEWFWSHVDDRGGIGIDEAGILLEGRVIIFKKGENLGERFVQVKFESLEEKFYFIAWASESGRNFLLKIDLYNTLPIWHNEHKMTLEEGLVLHCEQKKEFFRDLFAVCCEIGCFERSSKLASSKNIKRMNNLVNLFQRLSDEMPMPNDKSKIEQKSSRMKSTMSVPILLTVCLESLDFKLKVEDAPIEPYFLSICLFDVKNSRKISEDFRVMVDIKGNIKGTGKALYRISEPNDQIYLVVRVEKTLQATDFDAYMRVNPDTKIGSKLSKSIISSPLYTESQRYRMPLCFSARSIFKCIGISNVMESNECEEFVLDTESNFSPFYKHDKSSESDSEFLQLLANFKRPEKISKLNLIPGSFRMFLSMSKTINSNYSPSPTHHDSKEALKQKRQESITSVIEFPSKSSQNFQTFTHLLYVYPVSINLSASKIKARNILCRIYLRSEDDIEASPLDLKSMDGYIGTHVLHHRSTPEWYSEIKLALPVSLDPNLHLLFTFFHISCSFEEKKSNKVKQVENLLGYSWIPLLNRFRFIGGEHILPVAASLPKFYLQIAPLGLGKGKHNDVEHNGIHYGLVPSILPFSRKTKKYSGPDITWIEKGNVTIKINLVSTVWTKSGGLGALFAHSEKYLQKGRKFHCDDENTIKCIKALESIDLNTLRDFYPTIINQICKMSAISNVVGVAALKFLIFSFHSLTEAGIQGIIEKYIQLRFLSCKEDDSDNSFKDINMAEVLINCWIDLFETYGDGTELTSSLEHSKYLFTMIIKSIAVQGYNFILNPGSSFNPEECKMVKLVQLFTSELIQRSQIDYQLSLGANENLTSFICSSLSVFTDRYIVFSVINSFISCFGPGDSYKIQGFKYSLLNSLVEHPLFLELNSEIPKPDDEEFTRLDNVPWSKNHFLTATIMKNCRSGLGEVVNVRSLALRPIMKCLIIHEEKSKKSPLIYIPWLRVVVDNLHRISNTTLKNISNSSRNSSISTTGFSSNSNILVQAALSKRLTTPFNSSSITLNNGTSIINGGGASGPSEYGGEIQLHESILRVSSMNTNGCGSSISQISGYTHLNNTGGAGGDFANGSRMSNVHRMSIDSTNCDYLEAISAIKMSNPNATASSSIAGGTGAGSETETIVNDNGSNSNHDSADGHSMSKISDVCDDSGIKPPVSISTSNPEGDKLVMRRYDKLNELETSLLLISGLYLLKTLDKEELLKSFWLKSSSQERGSLLHMIHIAVVHFVNIKKNSTLTRKKVVQLNAPSSNLPSPKNTALPTNKKWSSLPLKNLDNLDVNDIVAGKYKTATIESNDWKNLSSEVTFIAVDALAKLCIICKGEQAEERDAIRTILDTAKLSENTQAMLLALETLKNIDDLATIVFSKGNEDLSHQLFCEILNGFGTSYHLTVCISILMKLFYYSPHRTTTQILLALANSISLNLNPIFVHNFRKSLKELEKALGESKKSSFILSITDKLKYIDLNEFDKDEVKHKNLDINQMENGKLLNIITSLAPRLEKILNSLWALKFCVNEYRSAELYLKLANSYSHYSNSRLRIEVFDQLKEEHYAKKRFSEALLCELHVAAKLARRNTTTEVKKIMLGISENLRHEFDENENELGEQEDTTEELIQRLENAVLLCEKAERYELMLEVYRILVDIQESQSNYASLEYSFKQMSRACALIQNKRERFLATYYKVTLYYPKKVESVRPTKVYVYKEPNVTQISEVCTKVETFENAIILSGEMENIPDNDKVYATITCLTPIPDENSRRFTDTYRKHQNVSKFTYDTPFALKHNDKISVDNKAAINQQWKRRYTLSTEYSFPAVVPRLKVINSEAEDLSPITNAIDDMQRRVTELKSELHSMDLKRIQLRLQGSVSVQVNQGPLAYAKAFLDKENEFPTQDVLKLKAIFRDFVECCGQLLTRNSNLISPDQLEYQSQLESDYLKLCSTLNPILGLPEAMSRMSRISISSY